MLIDLSSIERVKNFVDEISHVSADVKLVMGKIVVDPKSIMGIFTLNLFEPINFVVLNGDAEAALQVASKYIA